MVGRVQGVGFRYHAFRNAEKYHIKGTVKNLIDGKVEIYAQGKIEDLENFIEKLKNGLMFGRVETIKTFEEEAPDFGDFRIL